MHDIIDLAKKENFSSYEQQVLRKMFPENEKSAGNLNQSPSYKVEKKVITASFIRWLCRQKLDDTKNVPADICFQGETIKGALNLISLTIPFSISLLNCDILEAIDLRHSTIKALNLSGSRTVKIEADGMHVAGDVRLSKLPKSFHEKEPKFSAAGPVCLLGARIDGDLYCSGGEFNHQCHNLSSMSSPKLNDCDDCRERKMNNYTLVLERIKVKGSIFLCGGFKACGGGIHLGDSTIGENLNCTKATLRTSPHQANKKGQKRGGCRLACEKDAEYHLACTFNGEGMHVGRNLILNGIESIGVMRLTGAHINGDLESNGGTYKNRGGNAIHGDRLHVDGNIFFCDNFQAEGAVRLPRAEIGADLSFVEGKISSGGKQYVTHLYCEGIKVYGTMYLKNFTTESCCIALSNSFIGGDLNCTESKFKNEAGWAIKAKGMNIGGSALLNSSSKGKFQAIGLVCFKGSKLGMNLICTNGSFESNSEIESEEETPRAIMADDMTIGGYLEMGGNKFEANGGVTLNGTKIGSYLNFEEGRIWVQLDKPEYKRLDKLGYSNKTAAIRGGKLQVEESIYLGNGFNTTGGVMLNDASIGRNLVCSGGKITHRDGNETLQLTQATVVGSVEMNKGFVSFGEVNIDRAVIGGNLDCSGGAFVNNKFNKEKTPTQDDELEKRFALRAVGVKIEGSVVFKDKFKGSGIVSFQAAIIGRNFSWKKIANCKTVSLFLDSAKVGVLDDDEGSWPGEDKLQINDFQYQFMKGMIDKESVDKRCEKWLKHTLHFRIQPYEHLAAVLKRSGYEEEARQVLIEKNNRETSKSIKLSVGRKTRKTNLYICKIPKSKRDNQKSQRLIAWIKQQLLKKIPCYGHVKRKRKQIDMPVRLGDFLILTEQEFDKIQNQQTQSPPTKIKRLLLKCLVCYGYRPSQALKIGLCFVLWGCLFFFWGFDNDIMVPLKDGQSYIYQIATTTVTGDSEGKQNVQTEDIDKTEIQIKKPINLTTGRICYSLFYSIDTFLPVVNLQVADYWLPTAYTYTENPKTNVLNRRGVMLCLYRWFLIGSGWVVTTVGIASLTGIVRK